MSVSDEIAKAAVEATSRAAGRAAKQAAKNSRTLPAARFWAIFFVLPIFVVMVSAATYCNVHGKWPFGNSSEPSKADIERDQKIVELNKQVGDLTIALARVNSAREADRKVSEANEGQLKDALQTLVNVITQAQQENTQFKARLTALDNNLKLLRMRTARAEDKSALPSQTPIELLPGNGIPIADLGKGGEKLRCKFLFNDYYFCQREHELGNSTPQQ